VVRDDQPDAREGQAERCGETEGFAVPQKPANAGGTCETLEVHELRIIPGDFFDIRQRKIDEAEPNRAAAGAAYPVGWELLSPTVERALGGPSGGITLPR